MRTRALPCGDYAIDGLSQPALCADGAGHMRAKGDVQTLSSAYVNNSAYIYIPPCLSIRSRLIFSDETRDILSRPLCQYSKRMLMSFLELCTSNNVLLLEMPLCFVHFLETHLCLG